MNLVFDRKYSGRILLVNNSQAIRSVKRSLLISRDGGEGWQQLTSIPLVGLKERIGIKSHYLSRLLRLGVHHIVKGDEENYGVVFNKKIGILSNGRMINQYSLESSRPLSLAYVQGFYVFGEYRSNPERSPISTIAFNDISPPQQQYVFEGIRHVHGIYYDPYSKAIWITTGDEDDEAVIFRTLDNFKTVDKILWGSQQSRTIKLLFTEKFIYFGSDAPNEVNYIYRIQRDSHKVECLQQVGSSVFHGCKVGDWLFFSTAIEPSKINHTKYAEVWASPDGENWRSIFSFKKDILPMSYFQYGQVFFPSDTGDGKHLWMSPFATNQHGLTYRVCLRAIKQRFYNSSGLAVTS